MITSAQDYECFAKNDSHALWFISSIQILKVQEIYFTEMCQKFADPVIYKSLLISKCWCKE